MNKHSFLLVPLARVGFGRLRDYRDVDRLEDVKWISPVGSPALAFYDQGKNTNWTTTADPATGIVPAFATDDVRRDCL
jgi:hypothetical protein